MARLFTTTARALTSVLVALLMIGAIPLPAVAEDTSLEVTPRTVSYLDTVDLTATMTPALGGKTISFSLGGSYVNDAVTDSNGVATIANYQLTDAHPIGGYTISASFAGDGTDTASSDDAQLTVQKRTVTGSFTSANKQYDATTAASSANRSLSNTAGGTVALTGGSATFANKNVGTGKTVTLNGATLTGVESANYELASDPTTTASITAASLQAVATAQDKTYDGTTNAVATVVGDTLLNDVVNLSYTSAQFDSDDPGTNKTVTVSGIAISGGADAGNYTLANTTDTDLADIFEPGDVTVVFTADNKVYDGDTSATGDYVLQGLAPADANNVTLTGQSMSFDNANAGVRTATLSGYSLTGQNANNYNLANTEATDSATITPKSLTATFTAADKAYDTTTAATITDRDVTGRVAGEDQSDVDTLGGSATFNTKTVGTAKTVTGSGFTLTGTGADNYQLAPGSVTTTAEITAISVTGEFTAADKVYDSTTTAAITTRAITGGVLAGDTVTLTGGAATFDTDDVGTGKTVVGSGFTTGGADGANYIVGSVTPATATITQRPVTGTFVAANKVYDDTTVATVVSSNLANEVVTDDVALSIASATFSDAAVGTGKTVTATASLTGTDAANHVLTMNTTTANITQRPLDVTVNADPKRYDGDTDAADVVTLTGNPLAGDDATLTFGAASFDSPEVGKPKTITVTDIAIGGLDSGNYMLADTTATKIDGEIMPANGIIVRFAARNKTYNGTRRAGVVDNAYVLEGVTAADAPNLEVTWDSATFNTARAGTGRIATLNGAELGGTAASQYELAATPPTDTATIVRRPLRIVARVPDKVYDGTTRATARLLDRNRVVGDYLRLTYERAAFRTASIGEEKRVVVRGMSARGVDAANYTWNQRDTDRADINRPRYKFKADAMIRRADVPRYRGNDIFNRTGRRQTVKHETRRNQPRWFWINLQNDKRSTARQPVLLRGCGSTSRYQIEYFSGSRRITREVVNGTYKSDRLKPNESRGVWFTYKPTATASIGRDIVCKMTVTSYKTSTGRDRPTADSVKIRVTTIRA